MIRFDMDDLARVVGETVDHIIKTVDEPALRAVGFAGAYIFREEAKYNAQSHAKTYTVHRNIIVKRLTEDSDGGKRQAYLITVRKGRYGGSDAFYWRFVEKGHKIVPRKPKDVPWKAHRAAAELEYGTTTVPAYPFMRPAYDSKRGDAFDAMTKMLAEQMKRNATR